MPRDSQTKLSKKEQNKVSKKEMEDLKILYRLFIFNIHYKLKR